MLIRKTFVGSLPECENLGKQRGARKREEKERKRKGDKRGKGKERKQEGKRNKSHYKLMY